MSTYKTKDAAIRAAIKHFGDIQSMYDAGYQIVHLLNDRWAIAR